MKTFARSICLYMLLSALALAQQVTESPAAPKRVVLRAARLLDVKGGHLVAGRQIVIEGDRIVSLGPAEAPAAGSQLIDLGNATLLPGLIDAHTHLTFDLSSVGYSGLGISGPREALIGREMPG
jgi:imidazolonepropionase-like amidohydrolase